MFGSAWVFSDLEPRNPGNAFLSPERNPVEGVSPAGEGEVRVLDPRRPGMAEPPLSLVRRRPLWLVGSVLPKPKKAGRGRPGRLILLLPRELVGSVTWTTPVVPSPPSAGCGRGLGV